MSSLGKIREKLFHRLLSKKVQEQGENVIIGIAIVSFLLHLAIVFLVDYNWIQLSNPPKLLTNPIAAIYTPFSFILIYEVYLLIYYLPQSTTSYIGKQYEIITLIVIRRIFKDLANIDLTQVWFEDKYDLQFTYDIIATLLLFFLIFIFYRLNAQRIKSNIKGEELSQRIKRFINLKKSMSILLVPALLKLYKANISKAGTKSMSILLVPALLILALYSLSTWLYESYTSLTNMVTQMSNVNQVFFDDFFTILILVDVLILLFSFFHTHQFSKVIRNSGFVISTILMKLSFSTDGLLSTVLIVVAVAFGVIILWIHNLYPSLEKNKVR